jgi:hypothetical protein
MFFVSLCDFYTHNETKNIFAFISLYYIIMFNIFNNKTIFEANLAFISICVGIYVDGYIAVIRKMRIETKHSTTCLFLTIFYFTVLYNYV